MKIKTNLTPFCGGLIGILLGGYIYYLTGKHYPALLPVGVFLGSLIGYTIGHFKTILLNTKKVIKGKLQWLGIQIDRLPVLSFSTKKLVLKSKLFTNKTGAMVKNSWNRCSQTVQIFYKKFVLWLSAHPMNKIIILDIALMLVHIYLVYLLVKYPWYLLKSIPKDSALTMPLMGALFSYVGCAVYPFVRKFAIRNKIMKSFYADFAFYAKYGMIFYAVREIVLNAVSSAIFCILIFLFWNIFLGTLFFFLAVVMAFIVLALIREAFVSYMNALREKSGITVFVTTLIITSISYFLFRSHFTDPVTIWIIALCTGTASAVAVNVLINVTRGTVFQSLLFFSDYEDNVLEKKWIHKPAKIFFNFLGEKITDPILDGVAKVFFAV